MSSFVLLTAITATQEHKAASSLKHMVITNGRQYRRDLREICKSTDMRFETGVLDRKHLIAHTAIQLQTHNPAVNTRRPDSKLTPVVLLRKLDRLKRFD